MKNVTRHDRCRREVVRYVFRGLREEGSQSVEQLRVQLHKAWNLWGVESGELFMDKARSKNGSAHHHRWNWRCWNRLPEVSAEYGIVKIVEELCLHLGFFDDNTQIRLQGDNLVAELTISSNVDNEHCQIGCCLDDLMRRGSDLLSAWYTMMANWLGFFEYCWSWSLPSSFDCRQLHSRCC